MTTIRRRLDSTVHSGYTPGGMVRSTIQWGSMVVIWLVIPVSAFFGGAIWQKQNTPEVSFLQNELIRAMGDSNKWQSAYAELQGQMDWIDDSGFRTGWYSACMEMGQDEDYCYNKAEEVVRP